jgi:hypothetical protein
MSCSPRHGSRLLLDSLPHGGRLVLAVHNQQNKAKWEIRKIAGLDAIEEGIGRATEMNRPVFYIPGNGSFSDPQLLASMAVLSEVAKMTAKYDTRLIVCVPVSAVYPVIEEIVRQSYVTEGKIESYKAEDVRWFSDHYFGYAIAIVGLMFKERVATNIMLGTFAFDALMYAEAASRPGAIQIWRDSGQPQVPLRSGLRLRPDRRDIYAGRLPHQRPGQSSHAGG